MWLLTSQFLDHLYLLGSQKVIGLQPFAGVIYIYKYINFCSSILSVVDALLRQVSQTVRLAQWWMHNEKACEG